MKLEAIRAFLAVAEKGNLREAAEQIGRTQSALSMTLKHLEAELGGRLFETDRKTSLSDLGRFVRDAGAGLVGEHDRVVDLIRGYAQGRVGRLRIASVPSVAALVLPDIIAAFLAAHEHVRIDLMDSDSGTVRAMVADGRAALGIAGPASGGPGLETRPLFRDPLQVVCRVDCALARSQRDLTWAELAGEPMIVNETFRLVADPEAQPLIGASRLSARNIPSLLAMVRAGIGITVLPGLATRTLTPDLIARPLAGGGALRPVGLLTRRGQGQSPLVRSFADHLYRSVRAIGPGLGLLPDG